VEDLSARREFLRVALVAAGLCLLSFVGCRDRLTWLMEAAPVIVGVALAWILPLAPSRLLGRLLLVHAVILLVGAHWTYAEVPAGFWVRDALGLSRNHFDRLGHVFQGLVPALIAREILLRRALVVLPSAASALGFACALAFSAFYELIEWWAALILGAGADAFLGSQGDSWDTQSDMACAAIGAGLSMTLLARWHDQSISRT